MNKNIYKKKMILVLCTVPDTKTLNILIEKILKKKIAFCFNIIKNIKSIYFWKKKIKKSKEIKIFIKTFYFFKKKIIDTISKYHPYEIPEILILKIKKSNKKYLEWMNSCI